MFDNVFLLLIGLVFVLVQILNISKDVSSSMLYEAYGCIAHLVWYSYLSNIRALVLSRLCWWTSETLA